MQLNQNVTLQRQLVFAACITKEGAKVDLDKIQAILDLSISRIMTQLRRFSELCSIYRRFVKRFRGIYRKLEIL